MGTVAQFFSGWLFVLFAITIGIIVFIFKKLLNDPSYKTAGYDRSPSKSGFSLIWRVYWITCGIARIYYTLYSS